MSQITLRVAADAGAVEAHALHPDALGQVVHLRELGNGHREVLPKPGQIVELEVDDLDVVGLD
jgi:hypothetical protein